MEKVTGRRVGLDIMEISRPELNATLVAQNVAEQVPLPGVILTRMDGDARGGAAGAGGAAMLCCELRPPRVPPPPPASPPEDSDGLPIGAIVGIGAACVCERARAAHAHGAERVPKMRRAPAERKAACLSLVAVL